MTDGFQFSDNFIKDSLLYFIDCNLGASDGGGCINSV